VTPIRFSISAALCAKALAGGAAVALAAGAAASTATTRSVNPANWGQHVVQVVEQCKAGDGDVGKCVSAMAQEHGEQVREQHGEAGGRSTASPSPESGQHGVQETGQSSKDEDGSGGAAGTAGHAQGHDGAQQTPGAANQDDHGHGKPSPRS
jgi:hypothetical protein